MKKPLTDMTKAELNQCLQDQASTVIPSTNDVLNELHRREMRGQAHITLAIGAVATIVAVASVIVAAVK
jgi:hypothetical protein